jgi:cytochrome b561
VTLKSGANYWGDLAKFFHWTIVLLILVQGTIGLIMVELPKRPDVIPVFSFHKSLGLTIFALALLRLAWRAFDPRPGEPANMPRWQVRAARAGHAFLYLLLFIVPLSGWWFDSVAALRPLYWFGLIEVPHLTGPDKAMKDFAADTHETLFWLLVVIAAGHAAVALYHQFVSRDNVLGRMWPASLQRKPRSFPENPNASNRPPAAVDPDPAARRRA